ncbi:hypothetical protein ACFCX4_05805 [Kitasatospora sp. NPDC056327]|uniref:hypothetical protein n=1 Tax=Kitasatospora sp. NPDC056327 TaxID=3345785 RepID=UPI0035D81839
MAPRRRTARDRDRSDRAPLDGLSRPVASWALDGRPPRGVPAGFAEPCARTGRDLLRAAATGSLPPGLRWHLSVDTAAGLLLGLASDAGGFARDADPALPAERLTARVAGTVQDHLAGYEFVQWPACPGHTHLLTPVLSAAGQARWRCRADGREPARIGDLTGG